MNQNEINVAVRAWLNSLPGLISDESSPSRVLQRAWGASGIECSLGSFTDAMHLADFRPEQLGGKWILRLPSKPIAGAGEDRRRRLGNVVG